MRSIAVSISCLFLSGGILWAGTVDPANNQIRYLGRWDRSDPSQPWCAWQSSSIKATFRCGPAAKIVAEIDGGGRVEFARVIVDGNAARSKKIELSPARKSYILADDLAAGEHTIEIYKESYTGKGRLTFHGFETSGATLVESKIQPPKLRIEFYGDSNAAGFSLEHEKNKSGTQYVGCYYTYAGIASRMLDAEFQNISASGAVIAGRLNSGLTFYDRVDRFDAEPRWDFASFPADIVVINLGANDINGKTKTAIKADYKKLVATIRKVRPTSQIVLMNGFGWDRNEPANYTQEVLDEIGDENLSRLTFPWYFNEWHGCEYDHAGMARDLVDHLARLNPDWKPVRISDVMDGFGRGGDVANGSFEAVAPFGGYGWRYFQDGTERIRDPNDAADGEWFLRIPQGKQVHQPNAASPGRTYVYQVRMRAAVDDSVANLRIEFRDQQWRNEITGAAQEFRLPVTRQWQQYTAELASPVALDPPDPSHDPWQIILRLQTEHGTVDFDDVRLSSRQP